MLAEGRFRRGDLARASSAVATRLRSTTTSCRRSSPGPAPRSWSAASASTSSVPRCSPTAPTSRRRGGCRSILHADQLFCQLFSEPDAGSDLAAVSTRRRAGRRRLGAPRAEGVDLLRPVRRLGPLPRPHRSGGTEAQGHLAPSWSTCERRGVDIRPLAPDHRRSPTSTRCSSTRRSWPTTSSSGPSTGGWAVAGLDAHPRAGHQPPPARHPHPAARRAGAPGRRPRPARRSPTRPPTRPGVRRGPAVPAPELALAVELANTAASSGAEAATAKLYWSEMSQRLHATGAARARRRGPAVAGGRPTTRATVGGSGRGCTTGRRRSSPAPTRSSATSSASERSASPASPDQRSRPHERCNRVRHDHLRGRRGLWPRSP